MTIIVARDSKFGKLLERAQQDEDADTARPTFEQQRAEIAAARAALNALGIGAPGTSEPSLAAGVELLASALGAAQETARLTRGDFDGLMDAIELSGKRRQAEIAGYWRRIGAVERQVAALLNSVRARDQAVRDAAAEVVSVRAELDLAREQTRGCRAEMAEVRAARDFAVGCAIKERDEARALAKKVALSGASELRDRLVEADGTLEAVRAELLKVTAERDRSLEFWRSAAYQNNVRLRGTIRRLRDRLSEQAHDQDPQRNVTAGLLRVEQARCARYDEINWGLIEQRQEAWVARDAARAEVERLRADAKAAPLTGGQLLARLTDGLPECGPTPNPVDDVDWHVPAPHVPVALAANEDAEWSLAPEEVDP